MSQANVEVVRKPLRVRERSSRPLDQRLFLRFPRLVEAYARLIGRLPPTSRIRQAALWRAARNGAQSSRPSASAFARAFLLRRATRRSPRLMGTVGGPSPWSLVPPSAGWETGPGQSKERT
jgi:hypothetical protein